MPSDALTVAVTTGLGVSVLAGLLSGICYVLTHGLPKARSRKPLTPWHCNVCGQQFRSIQGILEIEKVVTCAKCKEKVCRVRCSKRDPQRGWICQVCQEPENWFKGLLKSIYISKDWSDNNMDSDALNDLDEDLMELRKKEREQVRDFIERLVESMLGGNLDDVTVSQVYNDKKYDSLFVRYHTDLSNALTDLGSALHISISNLPITGQTPCSAHAYLKQLIERFVGEAGELPSLKRYEDHPAHPEETLSNRTYEDLLSTAIINKVVQTSQHEARSSATSSRTSATSRKSGNKEYFFGEETLENKWKNHDNARDDASSVSSLDDWVRSDSSISSSKYIDRVSLTIKQQIEEGSSSEDESADNISHVPENNLLHSSDETWHENWYFQKRRLTNSSSPVPVPMLVPNPITEAKVLIGDKEAGELSDIDSDYGDPEMVPDIKNILVNSKTIIGGKNAIRTVDESFDAFHKAENAHVSDEDNEEIRPTEPIIPDANTSEYPQNGKRNEMENHDERILEIMQPENENTSLMSIESNTEQDTEYTEQYASLPRTFLKMSTPVSRKSQSPEKHIEKARTKFENGFESEDLERDKPKFREDTSDSDEETLNIFKGSYSEREKEKWKHSSIEIPHNPYSPENLERRLSSRSSNGSSSSIYGRDYYIRNAAKSAGTRSKKLMNDDEVIEYSSTLNGNENNSEEPYKIVSAIPIVIESENNEFESIGESSLTSPTRPSIHDISSDSDLSIERVYNLQSGKVFEKKGNVSQEISTKESYSPEGLMYVPKEFDEDIKSTHTDENHNTTILDTKRTFLRSLTQSDEDDQVENEYVNSGDIVSIEEQEEQKEETIDIVPYDENKFKATLEMFKVVSEKVEIGNKNEKLETSTKPHEIKVNVLDTDIIEKINDDNNEISLDVVDSIQVTDIHQPFAEEKQIMDYKINTSDYSEEDILSDNREFSLEYSTDINEDDLSRAESSLETDPEIMDLKGKRLVKDLLGRFSRSYPNISTSVKKPEDPVQITAREVENVEVLQPTISEELSVEETEQEAIPSVKSLKQLFDQDNNATPVKTNTKQIYSLTARSLPKEFTQKLKSDDEASLQNEETVPDAASVNEETTELLPMDITKNMIAFYEHLEIKKKH